MNRELLDVLWWRRALLAGCVLSSGCQLAVDANLSKPHPTPDAAVCPTGFVCTLPGEDGDHPGEPDSGPGDGGGDGDGDGDGDAGPDTGILPEPPPPCTTDNDCSTGNFCANTGCVPNCNAERGCVIGNTGRVKVVDMVTAEGAVYWTTRTGQDALGNILWDGTVWRMDESLTSTSIAGGSYSPEVQAVIGDDVYFISETGGNVRRASAQGGGQWEEAMMEGKPFIAIAASEKYVWWANPRTDGVNDVWRKPRNSADPAEKVASVAVSELWDARDESVLFSNLRDEWGNPWLRVLDETGASDTLAASISTVGPAFFYENFVVGSIGSVAVKVDLVSKQQTALNVPDPYSFYPSPDVAVRAPWMVWMQRVNGEDQSATFRLGRTSLVGTPAPEVLLEIHDPTGQAWYYPQLALSPWSEEVFYFNPVEQRMFRLAMPAYPCNAELACPDGLACQPDQTCH